MVRDLDQIEWLILHYLKRATTLLDVSRITSGKLSSAENRLMSVKSPMRLRIILVPWRDLLALTSR